MKYSELVDPIIKIAREAGDAIMEIYNRGNISVEIKKDNSPVTEADIAANEIIVKALAEIAPKIKIVSEEGKEIIEVSSGEVFFLVDPLDGTKSFINRTGEFTVNIAIVENNHPVFGVVYLPVPKILYYTGADGHAYKDEGEGDELISVRQVPSEGHIVVASKSHNNPETDEFIKKLNVSKFMPAASSLKFCLVAEGKADIYPRFGTTMEWDTAAAHAVLLAAGGHMIKTNGSPFTYGKPDFRNEYFIAYGNDLKLK